MSLPIINGYEVSQTFQAGFVNFYLGENVNEPGNFKVWRQNPRESSPAWERKFTNRNGAMICLYEHGIALSNDQKKRTADMGIARK